MGIESHHINFVAGQIWTNGQGCEIEVLEVGKFLWAGIEYDIVGISVINRNLKFKTSYRIESFIDAIEHNGLKLISNVKLN